MHDGLITGAIGLAVVVSLPLLAVLVFVIRPVLLGVVLLLALGGALWFAFSPRIRARVAQGARVEPRSIARGLRGPHGRMLHPGHAWARIEEEDEVVVGTDDIVQAVLGPVEEVELPPRGLQIRRGEPLFRLWRGDRSIGVEAPITGTVLCANEALRGRPRLVNKSPYGEGWIVRLRGEALDDDRAALLQHKAAADWFDAEVTRILELLRSLGITPTDGADRLPARRLHREIDDVAWRRLTQSVFAAHRAPAPPPA
jgi:glycine cleavage system H protein